MPAPTKPDIWLSKNIESLGKINEQRRERFISRNGKAEIDKKFIELFFEIKENAQKLNTTGIINAEIPKDLINKSDTTAPEIPKIFLFSSMAESY